jgi:uncharacterized protein
MIHFEGDCSFAQPPVDVSARLGDATFLVSCLADVEVTDATPTRAVWKMRPGFSFIRTKLETTLQVLDHVAGTLTRYRLVSHGIGASSTVEVGLSYAPEGEGARVHWIADITQLSGLLKLAPRGLIQSAAQKVIEDTWAAIGARLAA